MAVELNVDKVPGEDKGEVPEMPLDRDEKSIINYGVADPVWDIDTLPLTYNDSRWMAFVYRADMDDLERITPDPLEVVDDKVEFWYVDHDNTMLGPYYEMGVTLACEYEDEHGDVYKGGYYPYMYLTGSAATDAGRVLGFPKKMAYIVCHESGGADVRDPKHEKDHFTSTISRNGYVMHSSSGEYDDADVTQPEFYGDPEWGRFNMKIVSNSDLTETQWDLTFLDSEWEGEHRFQLHEDTIRTASPDAIDSWFLQGTPFDNMGALVPPQELLGLVSFTFDLIIPPAETLWSKTVERDEEEVAEAGYAYPYTYGMRQRFPKPKGV